MTIQTCVTNALFEQNPAVDAATDAKPSELKIKSKKRFTLLPIVHDDLWKAYKNVKTKP
jgi:hypothetical protein